MTIDPVPTAVDPTNPDSPMSPPLDARMEAMLEAQAVATHRAAMDCFERANRSDQSDAMAIRLYKCGAQLMRAMADATRSLERLRTVAAPAREPAPDDEAPIEAQPEAAVRDRIARVRRVLAAEHGFALADNDDTIDEDPFSADALVARLRPDRARGRTRSG